MSDPGNPERPAVQAALAVWTDIEPAAEADFNQWYDREHVFERIDIPGFVSGARYRADDGDWPTAPRYFAFYEVRDPAVLRGKDYLARLNAPSAWTRRAMPKFRNFVRGPCVLRADAGRGRGGSILTLRCAPRDRGAALASLLPHLIEMPGIFAARLWQADAADAAASEERTMRADPDQGFAWALTVEAGESAAARALLDGPLAPDRRSALAGDCAVGLYSLIMHAQPRA